MDEIRRELRKLISSFGPDYWRVKDAERTFPTELYDAVGAAGYYGTLIPREHGGSEAGPGVASLVVEEINAGGGDAAVVNAQMAICSTLIREGEEGLKSRYLPAIASGELRLFSVAATEPDSGADMTSLQSSARRDGNGWVLDARKVLISFAEHTHLMFVLARAEEGPTLFLIDLREVHDEIEIRPIELVTNRFTTTLFIEGLRVSDATRIGEVGAGLRCLMKGFATRRCLAAAESIGNARFMLARSLDYARIRQTSGRVIGEHQGVQYPLAEAYAKVEAADLMRWDALRLVEAGKDADGRSALAKILASEAAWEMARAALTTFGGWGLAAEYHIERKLRDCTVHVFNNLLLNHVATRALGLPSR